MAEEIVIGIKTSTTLIPIPVKVGLHELLDHEWETLLEREVKLWSKNLNVIRKKLDTRSADTKKTAVKNKEISEKVSRYAKTDKTSSQISADACCADQFAFMKSLQGLLGERLKGIVQVEVSWQVLNAPADARVEVLINNQDIHSAPYQHYKTRPLQPTGLNPRLPDKEVQSYQLAVHQPLEGSLIWTVNDHFPAVPEEVGDYIRFWVSVYKVVHARKIPTDELVRKDLAFETALVLMPRARP